MARVDELKAAALNAIPVSGEIEVSVLLQNLRTSGNGDAIPMLSQLKREGKVKASLYANEGEPVRHVYARVEGA